MYPAIQAHTHPYSYVHEYTHTHTCMYALIHEHIYTYTRACTHTWLVFFLLKTEVLLGGLKGLVQASVAHSPRQRHHFFAVGR